MTSKRALAGAPRRALLCSLALSALSVLSGVLALAPAAIAEPRLGGDVVPTFEAVRLHLDPARADYSGAVTVDLDVRRATALLRFHARGQTFTRVALSQGDRDVPVAVERGENGDTVARAQAPLAPGAYRLAIEFTQAFDTHAVSLFRMEKDGRAYAYTQFEAADARGAFPCWDEPGFKNPWQVTLEIPAALQAVTNTPLEKEEPSAPAAPARAWKTLTFARTPPLPSYLLAVAVGAFDFTPIPGLSVPGRVVSPAGQGKLAGLAVETAPRVLAALERYFGQPYPFAKLDLIAVPELSGAMENAGAVTFTDSILLTDPGAVSAGHRAFLAYVMTHELAHMWFGDLVTMAWWDDLWLNESFADWMTLKIVDQVFPDYGASLKGIQDVNRTMGSDAQPSARAIHQPVNDPGESIQAVGVTYDKGKAVLAMFESWLGPEVFRKGVIEHLRARAWGNAVAADFWAALERASGRKDVAAALAGFLDQPGLPLVEVEPLPGGRLRLSQRRFLARGVSAPPLAWTVPVGLKVSDGKSVHTVHALLGPAGAEVAVPGLAGGAPGAPAGPAKKIAWVMPNLAAAGYYRWQVPGPMLAALSAGAAQGLDTRERIALLANLAALLDAGLLPGDRYLAALTTRAGDPEPWVLSAVADGLGKIRPLVPESREGEFAAYVRRTLGPALERIGAEPRPGEDPAVALLRPRLLGWLGLEGHDEAVVARAAGTARRLLADPAGADPALAEVTLRIAAGRGDRALFDELRRRFEGAQAPGERGRLLSALAAFRDPLLASEALRYSLEGPLRPNERLRIPAGILFSGERGAVQVLDWTVANYDRIAAVVPPMSLAFLPRLASGCSAERLARAREFFGQPAHSAPGTDAQLAQVADEVALCVALRASEGPAIGAYLERAAAEGRAPGR
jgi:alanyl aminopeptidase